MRYGFTKKLIGLKFGNGVALDEDRTHVQLVCECGRVYWRLRSEVLRGRGVSCGCHRTLPKHDLSGRKFGALLVVGLSANQDGKDQKNWDCVCDCGTKVSVRGSSLVTNNTRSCGCLVVNTLKRRAAVQKRDNMGRYLSEARA